MMVGVGNRNSRCSRHGTVYVAVLGVALLVTIVGLSALLAVRVEHRMVTMTADAVQADYYAQSAVDVALYMLSSDPNWRNTYTSGVWSAPIPVEGGSFYYKFVDDEDGDLADDATQPVRLHGGAVIGNTVRIYSVLCEVPADSAQNLLSNPGFEDGTTDWYGQRCTIEAIERAAHSGADGLGVDVDGFFPGRVLQEVTDSIESGVTYTINAWIKVESEPVTIEMSLSVDDGGWQPDVFSANGSGEEVSPDDWVQLTGTVTPTWNGELDAAVLRLGTPMFAAETAFLLDDVEMIEAGDTGPELVPVPGTWRREVLP